MRYDDIRAAVDTQLNTAVHSIDEAMVTKWVLVFEAVDANGGKSLHEVSDAEVSGWDAVGMLKTCLDKYTIGNNSRFIEED